MVLVRVVVLINPSSLGDLKANKMSHDQGRSPNTLGKELRRFPEDCS